MKNIAVILAGGTGTRTNSSIPKQFFKLAGMTVIEHSISLFNSHPKIDEVWVVINSRYFQLMEEIILKSNWSKLSKLLKGGNERRDSSLVAINACDGKECNLIFHDSVRPLVSSRIIDDVIASLQYHNAIDVAIPVADTIIHCENNQIVSIPDRAKLKRGQTPQAFRYSLIKKAYELAIQDPDFNVTDDCGVINNYIPSQEIFVVDGEEKNMKITYNEDVFILDKLFQLNSEVLSGKSVNRELLRNKVAVVFGGSYGIGLSIANKLQELGVIVYSFSRSLNNVDISNRDDVERSLAYVFKENNRINYVINTAALLQKQTLVNTDVSDVRKILDINLYGAVNIAQLSYKYLVQTKGTLLLYTSSSYTRGRAFYCLYSATKAAIVNMTQALAQEWQVAGVKVNCINPERTNTPMRVQNFGIEPIETLLTAERVADDSINALLVNNTGQIYDVKL